MLQNRVHKSTKVLVAIAMFDLVLTLALLRVGMAEGNPLFAWLLQYGERPFIAGKVLFVVGPVLMLEWARTRAPRSAERGTWIAAVLYVLLLGTHLTALAQYSVGNLAAEWMVY